MFCINMKHIVCHASPHKEKKTLQMLQKQWFIMKSASSAICLYEDRLIHVYHLPYRNCQHVKLKCHSVKAKVTDSVQHFGISSLKIYETEVRRGKTVQ